MIKWMMKWMKWWTDEKPFFFSSFTPPACHHEPLFFNLHPVPHPQPEPLSSMLYPTPNPHRPPPRCLPMKHFFKSPSGFEANWKVSACPGRRMRFLELFVNESSLLFPSVPSSVNQTLWIEPGSKGRGLISGLVAFFSFVTDGLLWCLDGSFGC